MSDNTALQDKVNDLKGTLFRNQFKQLQNYLNDDEKGTKSLKFLAAVAWCYESIPKLSECTKESVLNSFMKMAELDLYPSNTSGQAYILPYYSSKNRLYEAQFQL